MFTAVTQKVKTLLKKDEVETLTLKQEETVNWLIAEEFLRSRLGVKTTKENIRRFVEHMVAFEREISNLCGTKKQTQQCIFSKTIDWMSADNQARVF